MQFNTDLDLPSHTYADLHPTDKTPWQVLCAGLDAIVADLRHIMDAVEPNATH